MTFSVWMEVLGVGFSVWFCRVCRELFGFGVRRCNVSILDLFMKYGRFDDAG